jgi:hypothetical protein
LTVLKILVDSSTLCDILYISGWVANLHTLGCLDLTQFLSLLLWQGTIGQIPFMRDLTWGAVKAA